MGGWITYLKKLGCVYQQNKYSSLEISLKIDFFKKKNEILAFGKAFK